MRDHAWSWFISYKTTCISFIVHSGTIKIPRCNLICRICWALSSDYDKREVREDGGQGPKMWTVNTSLYVLQLLYPQKRYLSTIALFHQNVCKVRGCANCVALQDFWDLPPFRHRSKAFAIVCIRYIIIYAVEIERLKLWWNWVFTTGTMWWTYTCVVNGGFSWILGVCSEVSLALQGAASWSTQYAPYLLLGAAAKYWTWKAPH